MTTPELSFDWSNQNNWKWIVWFRLEKAVSKEERNSLVDGMTIDNQNHILATLMALWTKPKSTFVHGKQVVVSKEEMILENEDYLNQLDEDIWYMLERSWHNTPTV